MEYGTINHNVFFVRNCIHTERQREGGERGNENTEKYPNNLSFNFSQIFSDIKAFYTSFRQWYSTFFFRCIGNAMNVWQQQQQQKKERNNFAVFFLFSGIYNNSLNKKHFHFLLLMPFPFLLSFFRRC